MEVYNDIVFESREEVHFAMWCNELEENGYIHRWQKVTNSLEILQPVTSSYKKETKLKTKTKIEDKKFTILNNLSYTCDFVVTFTHKGYNLFVQSENEPPKKSGIFSPKDELGGCNRNCFIEIKPIFDFHGKTARFAIMQKIIWWAKKQFVNLIIPEELFKNTFMPTEAMPEFKYKKKPTGKNKGLKGPGDWKTNYIPKTLSDFLATR